MRAVGLPYTILRLNSFNLFRVVPMILFLNIMCLKEISTASVTFSYWKSNVSVNVNARDATRRSDGDEKIKNEKEEWRNRTFMQASNEKAAKSNRTIYRPPDRKRRDCRIGYVFPRTRAAAGRTAGVSGDCVNEGLHRAGCIQKCIWLPGKRSMEQRRKALFRDLGGERRTFPDLLTISSGDSPATGRRSGREF